MRLANIIAEVMNKYSNRPAIGERDYEYIKDPIVNKVFINLLPSYKTITFKQLWDKVEAIANEWYFHSSHPIKENDKVAILSFTSSDYAAVDIACIRLGAVSIHLQTSSSKTQMEAIIKETAPTIIAASIEHINTATELAKTCISVKRIIVFDYHTEVDDQIKIVEELNEELRKSHPELIIESLNTIINSAQNFPVAPFPNDVDYDPLSMLIYTSGSTGSPKGAMYTEKLASGMWGGSWSKIFSDDLAITIHYMPMSHVAGHSSLKNTLARGGISYFTSKSNLTSFFDDISLVKPTELSLVPRVCEMIYQYYNSELISRKLSGNDNQDLEVELKEEMRVKLLGGRVNWAGCASAPLSKELYIFMESVLKIKLHNIYGSTEAGVIWVDNKLLNPPVIDYKIIDVPELGYFTTDLPSPRGELLIKTKSIIPGYYNRPELNDELFDKDGYYITGDIVEEVGSDNLQFLERRKNVIKLSQGEFVAIANLEVIFSASPLIRQVFVYGHSEWSSLLAVIVPTPETLKRYQSDHKELKRLIRESIREIASNHSLRPFEIPRDFIIESEPFSQANGLLSDHGKPVWPQLRSHYQTDLNMLYEKLSNNEINELYNIYKNKDSQSTIQTVLQIASSLVGEADADDIHIEPGVSFRDIGGDSISAVTFSMTLEEFFGIRMPLDKIVSTIYSFNDLADYIDSKRNTSSTRPDFISIHGVAPTEIYASQLKLNRLVDKQVLDQVSQLNITENSFNNILLTGATGYLGRFLCIKLMEELSTVGGQLICIVRGKDEKSARLRLENTFGSSNDQLHIYFKELADKWLTVIPGDISEPKAGVDDATWEYLSNEVDTIFHVGALVNHVLSYDNMFDANVLSTSELIELALSKHIKHFVFMSSIAVAAPTKLDEDTDIRLAIPHQKINGDYASGYALSKSAGEVLLKEAHEKYGLPVTVFRSSMILAHSHYEGQLNIPDMFTRLLLSIGNSGIAPRSFYQSSEIKKPHYDGLPVDFTTSSIVALVKDNTINYRTYNLVNPHEDGVSLDTVVDWLIDAGVNIEKIDN